MLLTHLLSHKATHSYLFKYKNVKNLTYLLCQCWCICWHVCLGSWRNINNKKKRTQNHALYWDRRKTSTAYRGKLETGDHCNTEVECRVRTHLSGIGGRDILASRPGNKKFRAWDGKTKTKQANMVIRLDFMTSIYIYCLALWVIIQNKQWTGVRRKDLGRHTANSPHCQLDLKQALARPISWYKHNHRTTVRAFYCNFTVSI